MPIGIRLQRALLLFSISIAFPTVQTGGFGLFFSAAASEPPASEMANKTDVPSFQKDVYPILRGQCFGCHQKAKAQGSYWMTDFQEFLRGGESGSKAVIPGKAAESFLVHEITTIDGKAAMPKKGKPLSSAEVDIIVRWIDAGAVDDRPPSQPKYSRVTPPQYVQPPVVGTIDYSNELNLFAVSGFHEVFLIRGSDWQIQQRLVGLSPRIESVRFAPDGKRLAVVGGEPGVIGELQLWNAESGELESSYQLGSDTLFGVNWSPDGSLISFAMSDNTVRAVDATTGEQKLYQRAHEDWPRETLFTVDGKHLLSAGRDMTVKLTEVETERFIDNVTSITPGALRGGVHGLDRHPLRDELLVGGSDGIPKLYRVFRQTARVIGDDANLIRQMDPMPGRIFDVDISNDGKYFGAVSTIDGSSSVRVWSYDLEGSMSEEIKAIQAKQVFSRSTEEKQKLKEYVTSQPASIASWDIPNVSLYALCFDNQGRIVASGSDGRLRVWNFQNGQSVIETAIVPEDSKPIELKDDSELMKLRSARQSQLAAMHRAERMEHAARGESSDYSFDVARVSSIEVQPTEIVFDRWNESAQLIVSAKLDNGEVVDVTSFATITSDPTQVWTTDRGWVQSVAAGDSEISIVLGKHAKAISVHSHVNDLWHFDFVQDVNPALSRAGCNSGTCHGAQAGKNGFKLSLRGYDPVFDTRSLTDDLAGRRFNPASPTDSLMLTKPLGLIPHTGGKLFEPGDPAALVIRKWIADGAKLDLAAPRVTKLQIEPSNPVTQAAGSIQQMRVVATYTDGRLRDVTREAFIESGNTEVGAVIEGARISAIRRGEAPILARYEGAYAATTLTVMGDRAGFENAMNATSEANAVDELPIDQIVAAKWKRMKIQPSKLCSDTEFIRRVYLDLAGLPPTADQVRAFLADPASSSDKRNSIIDQLIASDAYVDHWTNKWSDLLQVNSKFLGKDGASKLKDWIRASIANNEPYDQFVYKIVSASGSNRENPAASYFKILRNPEDLVENTTHLFLAVRFNCNKCHDHPFERWTQDQYYQTASYFAQVSLKKDDASGDRAVGGSDIEGAKPLYEEVSDTNSGNVKHQKTGLPIQPKFPFECQPNKAKYPEPLGTSPRVDRGLESDSNSVNKPAVTESRRTQFATWLTSRNNPYFARSFVNRMWGYLLGKGLIEPIDDIRAGNPASIPELLDYLESEFISHDFDVRHVVRLICRSRVYQLSIESNPWNADDDRNYSHAYPKRLPAEVLYDAIHQVTGSSTKLPGLTPGTRSASLADADSGLADGFLNNLGRPVRESACECERSSELRLGSIMALVSGPTVGSAIADENNAIHKMVSESKDNSSLINDLFLQILNRPATESEIKVASETLQQIEIDHVVIKNSLIEREAWWAAEKPKRQAAIDTELQSLRSELKAREELIRADREAAETARLKRVTDAQAAVGEFETAIPIKLDEYLTKRSNGISWQTLQAIRTEATQALTLRPQPDRSIQATIHTDVGGSTPGNANPGLYTITTTAPAASFNVIRLEALTEPSSSSATQSKGSGLSDNGNFVLTEIELFVGLIDKPNEMRKVKLSQAITDFDQAGFSAAAAIDNKLADQGGWAVHPAGSVEHWAVFGLEMPLSLQPGEVLQWRLHQYHAADKHRLGRFRLSIANATEGLSIGLSERLAAVANTKPSQRDDSEINASVAYFKASSTELNALRERLGKEQQPLPEDETVVALRKRIERASLPLADDTKLVQLRSDVAESEKQQVSLRLTSAEDLAWALINSPAFLFNH